VNAPVVEIHVHGGVAYVVRKDANVRVIIRDFDNDPKGSAAERYSARSVIRRERRREVIRCPNATA
jgi:hypothetical protein